jgi:HEAT repeat protein
LQEGKITITRAQTNHDFQAPMFKTPPSRETPFPVRQSTPEWLVSVLLVIHLLIGCGRDSAVEYGRQLEDGAVDVRRRAAAALLDLGPAARPAITTLAGALKDDDREVRRLAIRALGQLGPDAVPHLPAIRRSLEDDEHSVRLAAALAIHELDPTEKSHIGVLIETMRMGEGGTIVAVGRFGESAVWSVPTLVSLLQDRRAGIRRLAAQALEEIGPAASSASAALEQTAQTDADDRVRDAAREALAAVRAPAAR